MLVRLKPRDNGVQFPFRGFQVRSKTLPLPRCGVVSWRPEAVSTLILGREPSLRRGGSQTRQAAQAGLLDHPPPDPPPRIGPASSRAAAPPGCPHTTAP